MTFQLESNPSQKEQAEAQSQLTKSDEIQRLVAQAHERHQGDDCDGATFLLDTVIEVKRCETSSSVDAAASGR